MCTAVILNQAHPDFPVVIAANRDEAYERAARGPELLIDSPRAIGGVDEVRGGTWMGATEAGLVVGVTNQPGDSGPSPRSRGEVVIEALRRGSRRGVNQLLDALDAAAYRPFNLLYGDATGLEVAYVRPAAAIEREPVPAGLHILPNGRLDSASMPKVTRARELAAKVAGLPWPELAAALRGVLADHQRPPLSAVHAERGFTRELTRELHAICIHTPRYGTRSATLIALAPGRVAHYLHAPGPPCRADLTEVTGLLDP